MSPSNLRDFIASLDKTGDVVHIKEEVDWDLELGGIIRRACELKAPAPLFEKIKDYPGYSALGGPLAADRRLAIALGLPGHTGLREVQNEYERRMDKPMKPIAVSNGPCQEKVITGDDIDIFRLPVPFEHEGDGLRFIGTWHAVVTRDPDSDWVNWGMYRTGAYSRKYIVAHWHGGNDAGRMLRQKYVPRGMPMPVAIAIGLDPLCCLAAVAPLATGESEVDYAGGLRQSPVELVKCKTVDLFVPAQAELVLEGEILPDVKVLGGPFGDFPGYEIIGFPHRICRLKAITHRKNPILTFTNLGAPGHDNTALTVTSAVAIKKELRAKGVPVVDVHIPAEGMGLLAVVSVKTRYATVADHVGSIIDARTPEFQYMTMVVDDDVDIFNIDEVWHAFVTRCNPARGIKINPRRLVSGLTPYLSPEARLVGEGSSVTFDCTWPPHWSKETDVLPRVTFREMKPKELKDKILAKWKTYGYK